MDYLQARERRSADGRLDSGSATMVDEVYGHVDVHDPTFDAALRTVWAEQR